MFNLLPKVTEKLTKTEESKLTHWNFDDANPATAKISNVLASQFTVDVQVQRRLIENIPPKPEPNYVPPAIIARNGPSQISEENRGVADDIIINTKPFIQETKEKRPKVPVPEDSRYNHLLVVKVTNQTPNSIDLFIQSQSALYNNSLKPFRDYCRSMEGSINLEEVKAHEFCQIFVSTLHRATVTTTNRQEIKDYTFFANQRVGLEVEYSNGKVISLILPHY